MKLETDDIRKTIFRLLRDMWIALANESASMSGEMLAKEMAAIEEIEANFHP